MENLLLATLFLPLIGAILLLFMKKENVSMLKYATLGISLITFLLSIGMYMSFDSSIADFQAVIDVNWIESYDIGFRIGIDGMSMLMILLTTFITPIAIVCSFDSIKQKEKGYYIMVMLLQFGMTGVFLALDLFLFYIFWEIILIPMYFIIGIWGGKDRLYAAVKFFLFTVVGSLFMLVAIVWLGQYVGGTILNNSVGFTSDLIAIKEVAHQIPFDTQYWMFLAFALSFLIKVPLFPFHTWLPDAHTEAPTPGSVILAGVLLKMGTYGLIRFNLELFPLASAHFADIISVLAVFGIIYGAVVAMIQTDIKRLVAYTSVSHLGFVVLGIFSMTEEGVQGAIIQMVNHGISTGMLFLLIGMIYERRHTRLIADYGGIARVMPAYTAFFGIAMFSSIGLPGLNGFVGELLILVGAFTSPILDNIYYTVFAATGVIFAAVYLLWMFQRVFLGEITHEVNRKLKDLTKMEWAMLLPMVAMIIWMGVYPKPFLEISEKSTEQLVDKIHKINKVGEYSEFTDKLTEQPLDKDNSK